MVVVRVWYILSTWQQAWLGVKPWETQDGLKSVLWTAIPFGRSFDSQKAPIQKPPRQL